MLGLSGVAETPWRFSNQATPSTTPGTSVTPGASNAEGAWTQIASGANISRNVYGFSLMITNGQVSAQDKSHLLDIGIDPAGGTSYTEKIANVVCGGSQNFVSAAGFNYIFPFFIKAGSSVAVRIKGVNATAGTVRVTALFYGNPKRPDLARAGKYAETIGTITNSQGVAFTPGTSSAEGTWVSLGTTARNLWWWQICVQNSSANTTAGSCWVDLAYGDATNKRMIIENAMFYVTSLEAAHNAPQSLGFCEVPAGSTIYVRGSFSATPAATWNAVAIGIGG